LRPKEQKQDRFFDDLESFEKIVLEYRENSINFAKRYINDAQICEDIAQEAFAAVYVNRDKYNPKMSFKTSNIIPKCPLKHGYFQSYITNAWIT